MINIMITVKHAFKITRPTLRSTDLFGRFTGSLVRIAELDRGLIINHHPIPDKIQAILWVIDQNRYGRPLTSSLSGIKIYSILLKASYEINMDRRHRVWPRQHPDQAV